MTGQHGRHRPVPAPRLARGRLVVSCLAVAGVFALPLSVQALTGEGAASAATASAATRSDVASVTSAAPTAAAGGATTRPSSAPTSRTTQAPQPRASQPRAATSAAARTPRSRPSAASGAPTTAGSGAAAFGKSDEALPAHSGTGRRVVYSLSRQRDWLIGADGKVVDTHLVSGQTGQPNPGTYRVYSRSRNTESYTGDETMEYMVRFAWGKETGAAIGFHSIPKHADGRPAQDTSQLGEPLSAGCIRQKLADAVEMWNFAPVGTKVVVVP